MTFDIRQMMEKAVEVMELSIAEGRTDGKESPLVGAVLVKFDGSVETAHRGELREGDHAEYTLLERKNRASKLDGAVLFATLEPCAPGARNHPKISCAERIVNARVKEVWVGIEDPDPLVDRKGIRFLQDHGVKVKMFDRDLQERIRQVNQGFIDQALERAAAQEDQKPSPISLSPLENAHLPAVTEDLSTEALELYRRTAKIPEDVGTPAFNRRLALQGLLKEDSGQLKPTGFGLLLFGKEPRLHLRQAGLLGTIHFPDGREEPKDFEGPQVFAPDQALQWLRDKLPDPVKRSKARREPVNEALYELLREGIVNALVHRDYEIEGAKCQLIATPHNITVKSPGRPLPPVTLEQMQSFTAPMLSRNPILHYVFSQMELAEERGLGLKSMKHRAQQAGLPLPSYQWDDPYLVLTLYRNAEGLAESLDPGVLEALNHDEQAAWRIIASKGNITSGELVAKLGIDERKAQRILKKLMQMQLICRMGKGRATQYGMNRP